MQLSPEPLGHRRMHDDPPVHLVVQGVCWQVVSQLAPALHVVVQCSALPPHVNVPTQPAQPRSQSPLGLQATAHEVPGWQVGAQS